jgi:Holliday junction resolvasome RuvABC endonuclease subunit
MYNAICIDGSLQNLGLAVVTLDKAPSITGLIHLRLNKTAPTTNKKMRKSYDDLARFRSHWLCLEEVINKYDCKIAFGEVPSGAQDARANFAFGGVTAMYACLPVPFVPVYPLEVKEAATGYKHADKEDMIQWAYDKFPNGEWLSSNRKNKMLIKDAKGLYLKNENEHLADAVAVGFAGLKYI